MNFIDISKHKKDHYIIDQAGKHIFLAINYSGLVNIEIKSPKAQVYIFGIYIGRKQDIFRLNTVQHHKSGDNISDLLIKGVFFDEAKFFYEGLIKIDKNAQKTNAYQKNQNLIMSDKVFVDSRPFLEILANDVRCTHGSTTGQLNADEMYYLMTRNISKEKSEKLLIDGFIEEIFNRIKQLTEINVDKYRKQVAEL